MDLPKVSAIFIATMAIAAVLTATFAAGGNSRQITLAITYVIVVFPSWFRD